MQDETAKDNRQTATWISHIDTKQWAGFFSHDKSSILLFSNTEYCISAYL